MYFKRILFLVLLGFPFQYYTIQAADLPKLSQTIQSPTLEGPKRGSLAGELSSFSQSGNDLVFGSFSISPPFRFPEERGRLIFSFVPKYSPTKGITEWGIGFDSSLSIYRHPRLGDLGYTDDEFTSPWGMLVKGNDGYFYPEGLKTAVRLQLDVQNDQWIAFLPNGDRLIFGGENARIKANRGTYSWYIVKANSTKNETVLYEYSALSNANTRPYLKHVYYGGRDTDHQYLIQINYDRTKKEFVDYRSSEKIIHNQRVSEILLLTKVNSSFEERYRYALSYLDSKMGPGFYLESIRKRYRSRAEDPLYRFEFLLAEESLQKAHWKTITGFDKVLAEYPNALSPRYTTSFSLNNDGTTQLEVANSYALIAKSSLNANNGLATSDGFETTTLPPRSENADPSCRIRNIDYDPKPRILTSIRGKGTPIRVVSFRLKDIKEYPRVKTVIHVCDREGNFLDSADIGPFDLRLGPYVKFADLNRDGKADVVYIRNGTFDTRRGYELLVTIFENVSTSEATRFLPAKVLSLNGSTPFNESYAVIQDVNGDSIPDLVIFHRSGIAVWYGKGNMEFEKDSKFIPFRYGRDATATLLDYRVIFHDINGDGLPDAVVMGKSSTSFFINEGNQFTALSDLQLDTPSLRGVPADPLALDLTGSGNLQITVRDMRENQAKVLELSEPGTGLLKKVDDGKGNQVEFFYDRTAPYPGIGQRFPILSGMKVISNGEGTVKETFRFGNPVLHSKDQGFLGFSSVERRSDTLLEKFKFQYFKDQPATMTEERISDPRIPGIERFVLNTLEPLFRFGLEWLQISGTQKGFQNGRNSEIFETTGIDYQNDSICPVHIERRTPDGRGQYSMKRFHSNALVNHIHCLSEEIQLTTKHNNSSSDFQQGVRVERNELGLPLSVYEIGSKNKLLQEIQYNSDYNIVGISTPGKGRMNFDYDGNHLLNSIFQPDGVSLKANRDPIHDQVATLIEDRFGASYSQFAEFDSQERLNKSWSQLSGDSRKHFLTDFSYSYATQVRPGWIELIQHVDGEATAGSMREAVLFSGAGSELGTLKDYTAASGISVLSGLKSIDRNTKSQTDYSSMPVSYSDFFVTPNLDTLYSSGKLVTNQLKSSFGWGLSSLQVHQTNSIQDKVSSFEVCSEGIIENQIENKTFNWQSITDFDGKHRQFTTPGGQSYSYERDFLGRIVQIRLPSDDEQSIRYNASGQIASISRSGLGSIDYSYRSINDQIERKTYLGTDRNPVRSMNWEYDLIGRKTKLTYTDSKSGSSESFEYYYDGLKLDGKVSPGQQGRLVMVKAPHYQKSWIYRADGKIKEELLEITDFGSLRTNLDYRSDGKVKQRTYLRLDSAGNQILKLAFRSEYDSTGRESQVFLNEKPLYIIGYDEVSNISKIEGNIGSFQFGYDNHTSQLQQVSVNLSHQRSFSTLWSFNNRGFLESEKFTKEANGETRNYVYNDTGFLSLFSDSKNRTSYDYDNRSQVNRVVSKDKSVQIKTNIDSWETEDFTYSLDSLGRVVKKTSTKSNEAFEFKYGPHGRVSEVLLVESNTFFKNQKSLATFQYDDQGKRLIKRRDGKIDEVYIDGGMLTPKQMLLQLKVNNRIIGYLHDDHFIPLSLDMRNSVAADYGSLIELPEPYGERQERDPSQLRPRLIDYALVGYDSDMQAYRMDLRDYDPKVKRFLTPDPYYFENPEACTKSPVECNLYTYAQGNPVGFVDPTGNFAIALPVIGEIAFSVAASFQAIQLANQYFDPPPSTALPRIDNGGTVSPIQQTTQSTSTSTPILGVQNSSTYTPANGPVLPTNTMSETSDRIAGGHAWEKHVVSGGEFPSIGSKEEFSKHIENVMTNPASHKELERGREAFLGQDRTTIVITDPNHADGGTSFIGSEKRFDRLK